MSEKELLLEWTGDAVNDTVADAVMSLVLQIDSHPASVKSKPTQMIHLS
jgi:hypothetical protein